MKNTYYKCNPICIICNFIYWYFLGEDKAPSIPPRGKLITFCWWKSNSRIFSSALTQSVMNIISELIFMRVWKFNFQYPSFTLDILHSLFYIFYSLQDFLCETLCLGVFVAKNKKHSKYKTARKLISGRFYFLKILLLYFQESSNYKLTIVINSDEIITRC